MSSFFLFSASITLVLLSILSLSTAYLVDTDGNPILNGGKYYIIPIDTAGGGLTYTPNRPHFITPEKNDNSPGTPVEIFSPVRARFIKLDQSISLAFEGPESLKWTQSQTQDVTNTLAQKSYIIAGTDPIVVHIPFSITKKDKSLLPIYEIKYRPSGEEVSYNVGLFEDDGLLGITEYPTRVSFKKAFNVLELSTS